MSPTYISDYAELQKLAESLRAQQRRIVLTQGVYDLIHEGHALYLEKAKSFGDVLMVGVDSDELTRKRKGPDRPIVPEAERLRMLMHLRHVDVVTLRNAGDDIGALIRIVRPDVLIVSESTKDFTQAMANEYGTVCGEIVCLPPQATTSTTARIRQLTIEGAVKLGNEITAAVESFISKIRNAA